MFNQGKCPKCEKIISSVQTEAVTIGMPPNNQWKGLSCLCPSCKTVLSVEIDPIALAKDISADVVKKMKQ